jgi:hypothetical protein
MMSITNIYYYYYFYWNKRKFIPMSSYIETNNSELDRSNLPVDFNFLIFFPIQKPIPKSIENLHNQPMIVRNNF